MRSVRRMLVKKYFSILVSFLVLLSLLGCTKVDMSNDDQPPKDDQNQESTPFPNETIIETEDNQALLSVSVPAVTETSSADDGTIIFQYTYQHMSLILPDAAVANKIIIDFLNRVDTTQDTADSTGDCTFNEQHIFLCHHADDLQILHSAAVTAVMSGHFFAFDDSTGPLTATD